MYIFHDVNQRAHSEPLFSSLCVLSGSNVYMYKIGLLMYKYHHGLLPNILDMFEKMRGLTDMERKGCESINYDHDCDLGLSMVGWVDVPHSD